MAKPQVEFDPMQAAIPVDLGSKQPSKPKPGPSASKKKPPKKREGAKPARNDMRMGMLKY